MDEKMFMNDLRTVKLAKRKTYYNCFGKIATENDRQIYYLNTLAHV